MIKNTRDEWIRQIREACESISKNAESIVGTEQYLMGLDVTVNVNSNEELPEITVKRRFLPDNYIERVNDDSDDHTIPRRYTWEELWSLYPDNYL